jgi:hypothetical protein
METLGTHNTSYAQQGLNKEYVSNNRVWTVNEEMQDIDILT